MSGSLARIDFPRPVAHVYAPHQYAWAPYVDYVTLYGTGHKRVVFLGMNPGPFGMMQTGVPFGEIAAVRDWLKLSGAIKPPTQQHPKRPIEGFACARSEVSGRRLWGWAAVRFGTATEFFRECFVLNYCPLVFLEESGRNFTPDKLPAGARDLLYLTCDQHLAAAITALEPHWLIGIGTFARHRASAVLTSGLVAPSLAKRVQVATVLHPSPASPLANRGWAAAVDKQLSTLEVF
ncbi:MAG: single-stranded DNA-binding protein [Gammaproteobacteria bacterium]|nr:single-stranded DNA-binding protein [Gammaproteobacteria bacterium]